MFKKNLIYNSEFSCLWFDEMQDAIEVAMLLWNELLWSTPPEACIIPCMLMGEV